MLHNRRYRYTLSSNALRQLQKTYRKQNYLRMRTDLAVNSVFHLNAYGFVLRYMNKVVNAFPTWWVPTFQYTRTVDRANCLLETELPGNLWCVAVNAPSFNRYNLHYRCT